MERDKKFKEFEEEVRKLLGVNLKEKLHWETSQIMRLFKFCIIDTEKESKKELLEEYFKLHESNRHNFMIAKLKEEEILNVKNVRNN